MGKRKEKIPTAKDLEADLLDRYSRWKDIYENGCSDPSWEDGTNLHLVRNHILYAKKQCELILGDDLFLYPDAYFYPIPMEVLYTFMAVCRKLACKGAVLHSTKTLCYNEAVKFDWREVLC